MMQLQKSTLALILMALAMGGIVYLQERRNSQPATTTTAPAGPIFSFQEAEIQAVTIRMPRQTLELIKVADPKDSRKSRWQLKAPVTGPASDASVAYLLNLLATGQSSSTVKVGSDRLAEFGLDVPLARIEVKLANGRQHRLVLGQPNFNRSALYAQANPEPGPEQTILLVPLEFENAVQRSLSEWQEAAPAKSPTGATSASPSSSPKTNATERPNQR